MSSDAFNIRTHGSSARRDASKDALSGEGTPLFSVWFKRATDAAVMELP